MKAVDEFFEDSRIDTAEVKVIANKSLLQPLKRQSAHNDYPPSSRSGVHLPTCSDDITVFFTTNPKGCHLMVIIMYIYICIYVYVYVYI
jgi:hypothetical protein